MATAKRKIAIACQGGGSQTAFTVGVLKALFERDLTSHFELVSLSGASGGALCAMLVWYALFKGDDYVPSRLLKFWVDNTAQTDAERQFNRYLVESLRVTSKGQLPQLDISPSSPMMQAMLSLSSSQLRPTFTDLRALLRQHIDFNELATAGAQPKLPALLIGAAEIRTGRMVKFNSREEAIRLEHLLASCALPGLFPAVEFDGQAYWDGLFSDNPPVDELIKVAYVGAESLPQEIWVIKINPTGSQRVPQAPEEIADRRNEMVGNLSLFHQLGSIGFLNDLLLRGAFNPDFLAQFHITSPVLIPQCFADEPNRPYHIPFIEMSESLQLALDYESKLDRSPENVQRLIDDGERQAAAFLDGRLAGLGLT
ncbi:patatin-like phospholipase family protein [Crenobacter sp. SG2303]|uniref:Patatin-like phospholipase family protein n=1 Tax=Crenobacter oryzisoli TaxID=3056844 RepID=A0ABT7XI07_9NEIS|nr:patatin-like phospholipase family protein [Crenobacter sp. SG2303]MDN0073414.1 patatin-like phospholipase family protein [Crenobacter sp. SG2303]